MDAAAQRDSDDALDFANTTIRHEAAVQLAGQLVTQFFLALDRIYRCRRSVLVTSVLLPLHLRVEPHALASGEAANHAASAVGSIVRTLILGCDKALVWGKQVWSGKMSATFPSIGIRSFFPHLAEAIHGGVVRVTDEDSIAADAMMPQAIRLWAGKISELPVSGETSRLVGLIDMTDLVSWQLDVDSPHPKPRLPCFPTPNEESSS